MSIPSTYDYLLESETPRPFLFKCKNYEGYNIFMVSGVHGNEQLAVLSSYEAYLRIKTEKLINGELTLYMGANAPGLVDGTREYPVWRDPSALPEDRNLNRAFSFGKKADDMEVARSKVLDFANSGDFVLDVHNSPSVHNCVLIDNGPYAKAYVKWCIENDIAYILRDGPDGTLKSIAIKGGDIGFTVELGGMGDCMLENSIMTSQIDFLVKLIVALSKVEDLCVFKHPDQPFPPIAKMQAYVWHGPYGFIEYIVDVTQPDHKMLDTGTEIGHMMTEDGNWHEIFLPQRAWVCALGNQSHVAAEGSEIFYYQPDCSVYITSTNEC